MISYGNASGAVPPINIGILSQKGAIYLQRPSLFPYIATKAMLQAAANDLFSVVAGGHVRPHIGQTFALEDIAEAHRALEGRGTNRNNGDHDLARLPYFHTQNLHNWCRRRHHD